MAELEIGAAAPDFELEDADSKKVSLKDLGGQWAVLYFYPKDDTPGCTTEACEFTAGIGTFRDLGAAVIGVSPDPPESHRRFAAKHGLKVRLLSDPGIEVLKKYGAWGKRDGGAEGVNRSTVIIDPEGRIAHHWPRVKAEGHAAEVREKLEELRKV